MPKVEAEAGVLLEIASYAYRGQLKNLVIKRYKSGENKGKLFAEYSLKEGTPVPGMDTAVSRQQIALLLRRAASALTGGSRITLNVKKLNPDEERYSHCLAIER